MPPAPDNLRATVTATRREGRSRFARCAGVRAGQRATLRIELVIPDGTGPFPVFLTNHARNRPWIYTAVRRGYIAAIYHATDPNYGNGDDSDAWIEIYPEYDWSCLARWAWAASRTVDYLGRCPRSTSADRTGRALAQREAGAAGRGVRRAHRRGRAVEWQQRRTRSVALHDRAVRQREHRAAGGRAVALVHPPLRFFAGREDKLPVDQNSLMALVAPRGLMMYSGYAESAGNPLGFEQAYRSALRVYNSSGASRTSGCTCARGNTKPPPATSRTSSTSSMRCLDGVRTPKIETWIHGYTFDDWRKLSGEQIDPASYPSAASILRTRRAAAGSDRVGAR